ncbi:MAG TPA: DUF3231 family protein [Bacillota bacterium]|nr:DUF3231 family protein [Bacillota bacterium]HUM57591.1 DUF3231 family protein [Bacillota bacterium]
MGFVELFKNQNKRETGLHVGEAFIIWTQLVARYDILEITQFILSHANDTDFKVLVQRGLNNIVMSHIKRLEETMEHYQIPLPPRPPKSYPTPNNLEDARDEWMFRTIFSASQTALLVHVKAINVSINDSVRAMFIDFLNQELHMYDSLVKYGKLKGWVRSGPQYKH